MAKLDKERLPKHVAIIMDGNRRWAAKRRMPAMAGHAYVVNNIIEQLIERVGELGIPYITFWAWSTENWSRGEREVGGIMRLFRMALERKARQMIERGARLRVIGDISQFPQDIREGIEQMIEVSKNNTGITVTFALNYGGRDELVRAIKELAEEILHDNLQIPNITKEVVSNHLDTAGMPDPDLIIRTGGTGRLSGFMLWQSEYAELVFSETLMPDFGVMEFEAALIDFQSRDRRFGGGKQSDYEKGKSIKE